MIAAIADDLTGATEIAGLGWRHGLSADVLHREEAATAASLVVYDSDSRHCSPAEARRRVARIVRRLKGQPEWIFKKVDSVLRGNVLTEVEAIMMSLGLTRCLLAPANPTGGRVIRQGRYFIKGTPIDHTDFRHDPNHPRRTSRVLDLLGAPGTIPVNYGPLRTAIPEHGIAVAEAVQFKDVLRWARVVDARTLAAGGGDFFHALLLTHGCKPRASSGSSTKRPNGRQVLECAGPPALFERRKAAQSGNERPQFRPPAPRGGGLSGAGGNRSVLFVSGSPAESALEFLQRCRRAGWPVLRMPADLLRNHPGRCAALQAMWAEEIIVALRQHPKVLAVIGRPLLPGRLMPSRLGARLIATVARVLKSASPDCLCVEGGATAALLMRKLGWTRLSVEGEFARGVTAVHPHAVPRLRLVLKPGSYSWPAEVFG